MLGAMRLALACFVVIAHLTEGDQFFSHWGMFAVFGFYVISGYLMTFILNTTYAFQLKAFAYNRFLRLFPVYYVVAFFSCLALLFLPGSHAFHPAWQFHARLSDWLGNGLLIPFEFYDAAFRLVPPTWSVAVELINYFLLWLVVARSRTLAIMSLLACIGYHVGSLLYVDGISVRYSPFYGALLPFSAGACIYFFGEFIGKLTGSQLRAVALISFMGFIINVVSCGVLGGVTATYFNLFFYLNLFALTVLVGCMTIQSPAGRLSRSEKILGDLAYPVFLTHWIVAFLVSELFLGGQRRGLVLLEFSILPILVVSYVLALLANRGLEPLRDRVRSRLKDSLKTVCGQGARGAEASDATSIPVQRALPVNPNV